MKKKIYVISTKYLQLMSINLNSLNVASHASSSAVTHQDLRKIFNASKNDCLIACDTSLDAILIMHCLLKALPDFFQEKTALFAVPVIYAIEINEGKLPNKTPVLTKDLVDYADPTSILPYEALHDDEAFSTRKERADKRRVEKKRINTLLKDHAKDIYIYKIGGVALESVREAHYLSSNGITIKSANLRPQAVPQSMGIRAYHFFSGILSLKPSREGIETIKEIIPHKSFLI